jgi:D-serine deaminase-like pyridoxal phosphate-dependent protein
MVEIGSPVSDIDTPALLLDMDVMEKNIKTMAERFARMPTDIRPHIKTHKTPIIAHKQIRAGAIGVTCAKLGEAEVMVEAGIRNVLIANQVVGEQKVSRLMSLARHSDVIVAVEDQSNVRYLAERAHAIGVTLGVLVEVDVGNNRTGTAPGEPALDLTRLVLKYPSLNFMGLMGYEGFCQFIPDLADRRVKTTEAMDKLVATRHLLEDKGLEVEIVSGGGTGTHMITGNHIGVTEVEAGSYVFMDARYGSIEGLEDFGKALSILTTIISTSHKGKAICDAGYKALTFEFGNPVVKDVEGVVYSRPNEEHGHLTLSNGSKLRIGEKIELIPSHCCTNTNLYDVFHCVRDDELEAVWRIQARGRAQ